MVKTYLAFCHMEFVYNVVAVDKDNSRRLSYAKLDTITQPIFLPTTLKY